MVTFWYKILFCLIVFLKISIYVLNNVLTFNLINLISSSVKQKKSKIFYFSNYLPKNPKDYFLFSFLKKTLFLFCVKIKNIGVVSGGFLVSAKITPTQTPNYYYVDVHIDIEDKKAELDANGKVDFKKLFNSAAYVEMQESGQQFSKNLHDWIASEVRGDD